MPGLDLSDRGLAVCPDCGAVSSEDAAGACCRSDVIDAVALLEAARGALAALQRTGFAIEDRAARRKAAESLALVIGRSGPL